MMNFIQQDVFRLNNLTASIKLLPINEKTKLQQVILSDDQGFIFILESSGDQLKVETKQQVSQKEIQFIDLTYSQQDRDRLILASGPIIQGYTRKLRNYFTFDTLSADVIRFAIYEGQSFFTAGVLKFLYKEFMLNEYSATNDKFLPVSFYLCPDRINCMAVHYLSKLNVILGCQDQCVRVLLKDQVQYIIQTNSPVISMALYSHEQKQLQDQKRQFAFGLEDGTVFVADMGMQKANILFTIKVGTPIVIKCYDYFKQNTTNLIIAQSEGIIEIYQQEELKGQRKINESITSIEVGQITAPNVEIIVSTFSGRIIILKQQQNLLIKDEKQYSKNQDQKFKQLKQEVDELTIQLNSLKGKNESITTKFKLEHKIMQNKIIIDSQLPIALITLYNEKLKIQQIIQIKANNIKNYEIMLDVQEGQYGTIMCFVQPQQLEIAQQMQIELKCLNQHQSVNQVSIKHLPLSTLTIKGEFTKTDMNLWVNQLVPDLPNNQEDTVTLLLRCSLTDTYVSIKFKQGQSLIKSDSVMALNLCKQFIVEQANNRGIQIDVKWECNDESVISYIQKLKAIQEEYQKIQKQYEILPALKELAIDFKDFSAEFQSLLDQENTILESHKNLPSKIRSLEYLISETYRARCQLKGVYFQQSGLDQVLNLWQKDVNELLQYILK